MSKQRPDNYYLMRPSNLDLLLELPFIGLELVEFISLPVYSIDRFVEGICNRRYLKGKYVVLELVVSFTDDICLSV